MTGKNVVRREEGGNGNPFKRLIVFMRLRYRWRSYRDHCACVGFCNTTL